MAHNGSRSRLAVALVEMVYVTLTAGIYAGLQQKALGLRSPLLSNLVIAGVVPASSQIVDLFIHRAAAATTPPKATLAVCIFTAVSALFHLYVMRRGVFLTGQGRSLFDDFRSVPRLIAGFVTMPYAIVSRFSRRIESELAL